MFQRRVCLLVVLALAVSALAILAVGTQAQAAGELMIGGWMLNRFYGEPGISHFQAERVDIFFSKDVDKDIKAYVEWYYHHWVNLKPTLGSPWFLDSAFVNFTDKLGNQLRVGKGRNMCFGIVPSYGNRKHSEYGLVSETFTQERIVGAQYFGSTRNKKLDFGIAAHNALALGTRFSGTDQAFFRDEPTVSHFADKGEGKNLAVSARVAIPVLRTGKLGLSYRTGKLRTTDIDFLASKGLVPSVDVGVPPAVVVARATNNDTNHRWGLDFNYKARSGVVAQAEYYKAKASTLEFKGWDVLLGFEPPDPMGIKYFARYGKLDLDPPSAGDIVSTLVSNQFRWDQKQLILSVVKPLRKGKPIWLQLEWIRNAEDPTGGASDVDNDVLFLELFTGF